MKIKWAHLCDYATVSREGKVSVLGIFTYINAPKFPMSHALMYLVFEIEMSSVELDRDIRARIELTSADGVSLRKAEAQFRVGGKVAPGTLAQVPQIIPVPLLTFGEPGSYQWSIWLNERLEEQVRFEVHPPTSAPPNPAL